GRAVARKVRGDLDARLGADRAWWRERLHGGRRAAPRDRLWRHWRALESRDEQAALRHEVAQGEGAGARGLDATARLLEGGPARALLRQSISLQEHRWRSLVDADQCGSHSSRSGNSIESRRRRR